MQLYLCIDNMQIFDLDLTLFQVLSAEAQTSVTIETQIKIGPSSNKERISKCGTLHKYWRHTEI